MGKKRIITKSDTEPADEQAVSAAPAAKKSQKRQVINAVAHISVSYNNTIISITDPQGNVIAWSSAGFLGFRGTKKSTPYAANLVARDCVEKSKKFGVTNIKIVVKGIGPARESSIRGLASSGLNISAIMDATPVAHNGVKSPKSRRV